MNILVVDDNRDSADSLAALLTLKRHDVRVAYGGDAAVVEAGAALPEIVICDINMPGVDGLETARRLRTLPGGAGLKLIALTGWTGPDTDAIAGAGFDRLFPKPVDCPRLFEALAETKSERA
jgi:CheY-like chemotaxis protein